MVNHPRFSQAYIWGQDFLERVVGDVRKGQNQRAYGSTLIVGAGTGLDIAQLGPSVSQVVLLEPDDTMRGYLQDKYPDIQVIASPAESMDFAGDEFDTVITSLVLCTVDQVDQALREIHRVLKPTGQYLFMEHVKHDASIPKLFQNMVNPLWKRVGGGCHLNRDIHRDLSQSPLKVLEYALVQPNFFIPIVAGRAAKEDTSR